MAQCLWSLGRLALDQGSWDEARERLLLAARLAREAGSMEMFPTAQGIAWLAAATGDVQFAGRIAGALEELRATSDAWIPPRPTEEDRWLGPARGAPAGYPEPSRAGPPDGLLEATADDAIAWAESNAARCDRSAARPSSGPLTAREREVAALIARGYSNRRIADALVIAEPTAERHVSNILTKLGVHSRAEIAVWADRHLSDADPLGLHQRR
jgi:non-specific serine/threonine protein kinase